MIALAILGACVGGFVAAIALNRARWLVFPISGGGMALRWMGGPPVDWLAQPIDVPCEHCGAPPGVSCPHDNSTLRAIR